MVAAAFPLAKLATLFLRQISKPIANYAKESAKNHPFFRTYFCIPPAKFYNWCEVKTKMWVLNYGKPVNIPILNETMYIELGANLLGEGIVFLIAATLLMAEYSRQTRKETTKERVRENEMENLTSTIQELYFQVERQDTQIRELSRYVNLMETRVLKKPWLLAPDDESVQPIEQSKSALQPVGLEQRHPESDLHEMRNVKQSIVNTALNYVETDLLDLQNQEPNSGLLFRGLDYLYYNSILVSTIS